MTPPRIFVQFDPEAECFNLMAESYNQVVPAGPRLFRGPPHPAVRFTHESLSQAEADARAMRTYLAGIGDTKSESKKKARAKGA